MPLFFSLFNNAFHWYWGVTKIYVGSNGGTHEKGNKVVVVYIYFWFVKFLFVFRKFQVVNKLTSGWEKEQAKPDSFGTYYEWTRRNKKQRRKDIKFWCLGCVLLAGFYFSTTSTSFETPTNLFAIIFFYRLVSLDKLIYPITNPILVWRKLTQPCLCKRGKKKV